MTKITKFSNFNQFGYQFKSTDLRRSENQISHLQIKPETIKLKSITERKVIEACAVMLYLYMVWHQQRYIDIITYIYQRSRSKCVCPWGDWKPYLFTCSLIRSVFSLWLRKLEPARFSLEQYCAKSPSDRAPGRIVPRRQGSWPLTPLCLKYLT